MAVSQLQLGDYSRISSMFIAEMHLDYSCNKCDQTIEIIKFALSKEIINQIVSEIRTNSSFVYSICHSHMNLEYFLGKILEIGTS